MGVGIPVGNGKDPMTEPAGISLLELDGLALIEPLGGKPCAEWRRRRAI